MREGAGLMMSGVVGGTLKLFTICSNRSFPWRNEGSGSRKSDGRRSPLPRLNVYAVRDFLSGSGSGSGSGDRGPQLENLGRHGNSVDR